MKIAIREIKNQNFKLFKQFNGKKTTYFVKCNKRIIKLNSSLYTHLFKWMSVHGKLS
ncbi:hypothetical protein (plasmid) [Acinetobacter baumannii]|nr:hypothetical protein ABTJ_p0017 [Acinetobacter baumannii MDR-TJ]QZX59204.1 hypothetical protein [Acinetobacter baumannii]QZX59312.1 hypothetical protein [Acinetobacter baumannii]QZX59701.1 hypothetical protein [Acinetobacter baumannii]QZX59822.1 hypothetical protein [Acinetobacter baumannii]